MEIKRKLIAKDILKFTFDITIQTTNSCDMGHSKCHEEKCLILFFRSQKRWTIPKNRVVLSFAKFPSLCGL